MAHDVARLCFIYEKRPSTDLSLDQGLHFPADGYLHDPAFKQLLRPGTSFAEVCGLLRAGVLADRFLCAQEHHTRANAGGGQQQQQMPGPAGAAAAVAAHPQPAATQQQQTQQTQKQKQKQQQQQQQKQKQQQPTQRRPSPSEAIAGAAGQEAGPGSPPGPSDRRRPMMRWLEWPTRGGGQYAVCISERALKNNVTLPGGKPRRAGGWAGGRVGGRAGTEAHLRCC